MSLNHPIVRIPVEAIKEIDEHIANGNKIRAIKAFRLATDGRLSLKEAKLGIDLRSGHTISSNNISICPVIGPIVCIKSITVDMGDGSVEMDLEELSMLTLMNMEKLGIEEVRRLLDLHDMLKKWELGGFQEEKCD